MYIGRTLPGIPSKHCHGCNMFSGSSKAFKMELKPQQAKWSVWGLMGKYLEIEDRRNGRHMCWRCTSVGGLHYNKLMAEPEERNMHVRVNTYAWKC
jgi:hypothetical protein